jgi:acetyl esterase/lipase
MRSLFRWIVAPVALAVCAASWANAVEPLETLPLWANGAPGARADGGDLKVRVAERGERVLSNVHVPTLTPYLPTAENATGCAVIVAPGGGHRELWSDHEGHNLARWLSDQGIAAFVLIYRLANEERSTYTVDEHALGDMQRAIRTVRSRADEWHVNPAHVGVIGFSAGGEIAALSAMRGAAGKADSDDAIERQSSRPDFQALVYPGRSNRFTVEKGAPPLFIVAGYDDRPDISRGMAELYLKYKEADVPAELHIYTGAGHGFGVRADARGAHAQWPTRFKEWLAGRGMLVTATSGAAAR